MHCYVCKQTSKSAIGAQAKINTSFIWQPIWNPFQLDEFKDVIDVRVGGIT